MVTDAQLAGYVLEELLASLLQESGYELLSRPEDDPDTLEAEGHGLVVKGRGCTHQVDALGTLAAPVPFGLPLRLFVEAKHRLTEAVGIEVVRNAYGVLADVNQHCPDGSTSRRVAYQYSLVSTRGFSPRAVAYARTHGIALHDFSGDAWEPVRRTVDHAVKVVKPFLKGSSTTEPVPLTSVRRLLRAALGTLERSDVSGLAPRHDVDPVSTAQRVRAEAGRAPVKGTISRSQLSRLVPHLADLAQRHDRSLLIGYPDGQLVLALRPDHTDDLDDYLQTHGRLGPGGVASVLVRLAFSPAGASKAADGGVAVGDWVVEPKEHPGAFRLRIGLPEGFETGLLTTDGASPRPGWRDGCITIHRRGVAYRLVYEREVIEEGRGGRTRPLRARRVDRRVAITPEALQPEPRHAGGPHDAGGSSATAPPSAPVRPRAPLPEPPAEAAAPVVDESTWDGEEVAALLALLEERATAPVGRRRSVSRERTRASAAQALVLLHALARHRGALDREAICALLGNDPTAHFKRGTAGVTAAAKTLKGRREVVAVRGDVLTSVCGRQRAGSGGVTSVVLRAEFIEPLKLQARRMARSQAGGVPRARARTSTNATTTSAVPRQRSQGALTK